MKKRHLPSVLLIITILGVVAILQYDYTSKKIRAPSTITKEVNFTYKIIGSLDQTFGYEIYFNGKLFIHQTTIPSIPGKKGFTSYLRAEKTALLVIAKLNSKQIPPTVTIGELEQISAID